MVSKEKIDKRVLSLVLIYLLGILGMFSLVVVINMTRNNPTLSDPKSTYQSISEFWTLDEEGTKAVDVNKLGKYMDPKTGMLSIYYKVPELRADTSLMYRSKDVYTRILQDGNIIYETSVYDSPYYNKSPGNLWNMLNVDAKYSGKVLEMQIIMVYDTSAVTLDSLYLGDKADIIIGLCEDNAFGIMVSILLMLLGCVLLVIDFLPTYGRVKKKHNLWWIGIYALITGVWGMIETNIMQFFVEDMRMLQLLDNLLSMLSTVPLVVYIHTEYEILKNKIIRILCYISALYGVLCVIVQYSPGKDVHSLLMPSSGVMITTDIAMCIWLVRKCLILIKKKKSATNCILMTIGVCSICACATLEAVSSIHMDKLDRAEYIRVGMLVLCICFGVASQLETYKVIGRGLQYEFVSKLAYLDGLTGLGNRTAYLESLDSYKKNEKVFKELGIIYRDVNNLKKVNDGLGHEYGDRLICSAAKIIENSFGEFGKAYRIGGDEFCVLVEGNSIKENYKKAVETFQMLIEKANQKEEKDFTIQIAHGFSVCENFDEAGVEEAIAKADSEMYHNKAVLKGLV